MKRSYHKYLWAAALVFMTGNSLSAQRVYTLEECIEEALRNNVQIKNADNNLSAARHDKGKVFTNYFPTVGATGGGFLSDKGLAEMELAPGQSMMLLKNGVVGGVSATLPLFTGGQIVNGNRLAEVNVEVNRLQRQQSENEVRLSTEQYFWQVVMLKEKQKTLAVVNEQLKAIHKDVETAVAAGLTNRNDLLQVKLRMNETRSNSLTVENALAVSLNLLAQYIGHPADSIDVSLPLDEQLPERPEKLYRTPDASLLLTNEYHLLKKNVDANRLQYKMTVGKNLPTLAIGGGYMYEYLMDKDHAFWMGFATINIPLSGWWGGSHDIKKQKLALKNAENTLQDQSELLKIRMLNTWNGLTEAYKQMEIAMESIGQATENLRLQTDYYQAGTCTMSDLLEAQTLYQQSRDKYVESYAQYEVKKREYLQATGR